MCYYESTFWLITPLLLLSCNGPSDSSGLDEAEPPRWEITAATPEGQVTVFLPHSSNLVSARVGYISIEEESLSLF